MRSIVSGIALLALVAACGGGDDGGSTNPPPPSSTVVSVEVTPPTASLMVPETVQLTATPKDASGNPLSGKAVTWSTSAAGVATVSTSGLVASIAEGSVTITATSEGRSGTASITVTQMQGGPVVAKADIGPGGGTVGNNDIGVSIPAGAFTATRTVVLVRDTVQTHPFPENAASLIYRIDGIPAGQTVQARVRIRMTTALREQAAIALGSPVVPLDSLDMLEMGYRLHEAQDSAGHLVATVPIRGRPGSWIPSSAVAAAAPVTPADFRAAAELTGLVALRTATSPAGHFKGWAFLGGAMTVPEADRKIGVGLTLMEQAYGKIYQMGFRYEHRNSWPMDLYVMPHASWNGAYYSVAPFPFDPNLGYIFLNAQKIDDATLIPGTAIHEFFHFTQTQFTAGWTWPQLNTARWLNEATSTWIAEHHPGLAGGFPAAVARSFKDTLYSGVDRDLNDKGGYGKAPIIKYLATRWGEAKVQEMYGLIKGGVTPAAAFFAVFPEPADKWWPAFLQQHLTVGLYPWPPEARVPDRPPQGNPAGAPPLNFILTPGLGESGLNITTVHALSTEFNFLRRDNPARPRADWFGPDYRLPVYLEPTSIGKAKLLAFKKAPGSPNYEFLAVGDTVYFPGDLLHSADTALLLITQTAHLAPYTGHSGIDYVLDLRLPNGDWYFPQVRNLAETMTYNCSTAGDTDSIDIAENATSIFSFLAGAGTWTYKAGSNPQTWEWAVAPEMADSLRYYRITATSALTLKGADSIVVTARFGLDWLNGQIAGAPVPMEHLPVWVWLLVPVSALPFLVRRRLHRLVPWVTAATALVIGACDLGQIAFQVDESFEFRFGKFRFTADSTKPALVQMELRDGTGKTTVHTYKSEYWVYNRNQAGEITDSVKRTCTGSGTAGYVVDGNAWRNGVKPPATVRPSLSGLLGRPIAVPPALRSRVVP